MATLNSKTILIIGGSAGIGYAVAEASLASQVALVIIVSSNASRVSTAVARLQSARLGNGTVKGEVVDMTDTESVQQLFERVGEVDHLVFTSGDQLKLGFPVADLNSVKSAFDVRFWAAIQAAQSAKIRKGGSITLTTGSVIVKPGKGWSVVAGVAGAVDGLTRGLAVDLAPIRVNVVSPGYVDTELWKDMPLVSKQQFFAEAAEKLLVRHVAGPEEIAEAYLFLMKCQYITGQTIQVDGGQVLGA